MTTNFNFVMDNGFTAEKFSKVCVRMSEAMGMFKQTEAIYNFLIAHKGSEFTPTEIGLAMGKPFSWHYSWDNTDVVCTKKISDSLYWLKELGLVNFTETKKIVTIEEPYPTRVKDAKIIDGIEYVGYKYATTRDFIATTRHWFAL